MGYYLYGTVGEYLDSTIYNSTAAHRTHLFYKKNTSSTVTVNYGDGSPDTTFLDAGQTSWSASGGANEELEHYGYTGKASPRNSTRYGYLEDNGASHFSYKFKYYTAPAVPTVSASRTGYNSTGTELYVTFTDGSQNHALATTFTITCGGYSSSVTVDARNGYSTYITVPYNGSSSATLSVQVETHNTAVAITSNGGTAILGNDYYRTGSTTVALYPYYPSPTYYYAYLYYNANGGSGAPNTQSQSSTSSGVSKTFTVSSTTPTRADYTFLGWATSSSAATPSYVGGDTITVNTGSSKTLYAVWQAAPAISLTGVALDRTVQTGAPYVNVNGELKQVVEMYRKEAGVWVKRNIIDMRDEPIRS